MSAQPQQQPSAERTAADRLLQASSDNERAAALALYTGSNLSEIAKLFNDDGNAILRKGDFKSALERYRLAVWVAERTSDRRRQAVSYENVGGALFRLNDYTPALQAYGKALAIATAARETNLAANINLDLANAYRRLGDYDQALENLRLAEAGFVDGTDKTGQARTLSAYGLFYMFIGDYRQALSAMQKALALARELNNQQGIAIQINNMSQIYANQGDSELALQYARQALELKRAMGNTADLGSSMSNIARALAGLRRYRESRDMYQQVIEGAQKSGDRMLVSGALRDLGGIEAEQGNFARALEYVNQSLAIEEEIGGTANLPEALVAKAQFALALGRIPEAIESANRVIELFGTGTEFGSLCDAEVVLGKAALQQRNRTEARSHLQRAVEFAEAHRAEAGLADADQQTRDGYLEAYHEMIRLLVAQHHFDEALSFAERARGQRMLSMLQNGRTGPARFMTAAERIREQAFKDRIQTLLGKMPQSKAELLAARQQHEQFRAELYRQHPEVQASELGAKTPSAAAIRQWLRKSGRGAVAVEYVVMEKEVYALAANVEGVQARRLAAKPAELAGLSADLRASIARQDSSYHGPAQRLYQLLIEPLRKELRSAEQVVLAPDGLLWTIPFETLESPNGQYVLEQFSVAYTPSLAVAAELGGRTASTLNSTVNLLAVENSSLDTETAAIAQIYGASQTRILRGSQARVSALRAEASKHRVIHIASHGVFEDRSPMYSYLTLAADEKTAGGDGTLQAWEILRMRLHAEVVVLAACETARGRLSESEGAVGMAWAFLAAGANAVVASSWKVDSDATAALMTNFHRQLKLRLDGKSNTNKAGALRSAALQLREQRRYRHPYFWAGFSLLGSGN